MESKKIKMQQMQNDGALTTNFLEQRQKWNRKRGWNKHKNVGIHQGYFHLKIFQESKLNLHLVDRKGLESKDEALVVEDLMRNYG